MNNTALIKSNSGLAKIESMADLSNLGEVFVRSGFFADTKDAAQAVVKVMAGAELGFPPIASMTGIYIVKGKVSLSANLIAAAIKKSVRYNYKVKQLTAEICEIEFFENGQSAGVSTFTKADAAKAQTQNMDKFARNMLFARAMSNGAKWFCADIFGGPIYTPDELGAVVNGEGEVIDLPAAEEPVFDAEERARHNSVEAALKAIYIEQGKSEADWESYRIKSLSSLSLDQKRERLAKWQAATVTAEQRERDKTIDEIDDLFKGLGALGISHKECADLVADAASGASDLTEMDLPTLREVLAALTTVRNRIASKAPKKEAA